MFHIIDTQSISDVRQCSVGGIEEHICTCVILRSYPFSLQDSPKRFCNVQVRGIWWKEKQEKSSVFPYRSEFLNQLVPMHCSIVEHDKGVLSDAEGEIVQETDNLVCRHPRADWHDECQHEREHYILADKAFYCTSQARVYFCH